MKTYHILYTTSKKYFPHMVTSICSLLENNKDINFVINIIESGFTKEEKQLLDNLLEEYPNNNLALYDVNDLNNEIALYNLPKWHGSNISNAKLFAGEIVKDTDKVLYLDSDTLVVNRLKELLDRKTNCPISAVLESKIPEYMEDTMTRYFNSGVLLLNFEKLYSEECITQIYSVLKSTNINLLYPAQDLLNLALSDRIDTLDLSYNITPYMSDLRKHRILLEKFCRTSEDFYSSEEVINAVDNPHILHHLAYLNSRVWDDNNIHPFRGEYEYYRTCWDRNFTKDKNGNFLTKLPFLPYVNLAVNSFFSNRTSAKIKQKIK